MTTTPTFEIDQEEWGSRERYPDGIMTPYVPDKTIIHWGGTTAAGPGTFDYEAAALRGWQRYHMDTRGWKDVAYNYAIGASGLIYRLRGENRSGATSGDYEGDGIPENHEGRALAYIGGVGDVPTPSAMAAFDRFLRSVPAGEVVIGHNDVKATACPGPDLTAYIDSHAWLEPVVPSYRGVLNVPSWGEGVIDWGIASGVIVTSDEHPDDWDANATYGVVWALLERALK
jgi:hypothetical protein